MKLRLYVDPGLDGTGWALFPDGSRLPKDGIHLPQHWGVLRIPNGGGMDKRLEAMSLQFRTTLCKMPKGLGTVIIEFPGLWVGDLKSMTSAIRGDLFKLAALCGAFSALAWERSLHVETISPQDWKGQLPKKVVERRLLSRWGISGIPNHALDAVGMGVSAQNGL